MGYLSQNFQLYKTKPTKKRKISPDLPAALVKPRLDLPFLFLAKYGDLPESSMRAYFWIDISYEKLDLTAVVKHNTN